MKMAKVKAIVDESSMFSVATPSVVQLTEALKSAQNWTSKVASVLVGDAHLLLSTCMVCFQPVYFLLQSIVQNLKIANITTKTMYVLFYHTIKLWQSSLKQTGALTYLHIRYFGICLFIMNADDITG